MNLDDIMEEAENGFSSSTHQADENVQTIDKQLDSANHGMTNMDDKAVVNTPEAITAHASAPNADSKERTKHSRRGRPRKDRSDVLDEVSEAHETSTEVSYLTKSVKSLLKRVKHYVSFKEDKNMTESEIIQEALSVYIKTKKYEL